MYWCPSHINRSTWILVKRTMCCNHLKSRVSFDVHAMRSMAFRAMDKENCYSSSGSISISKNIYILRMHIEMRWKNSLIRVPAKASARANTYKNAPHQNSNNTERINGVMQMQWKVYAAWNHVISWFPVQHRNQAQHMTHFQWHTRATRRCHTRARTISYSSFMIYR